MKKEEQGVRTRTSTDAPTGITAATRMSTSDTSIRHDQQTHRNRRVGPYRPKSDVPFFVGLGVLGGFYVVLIAAMLLADVNYAHLGDFSRILADANIRYAIRLSLISCTITTILALWVAVPIAYLMSRTEFRGKNLLDGFLDIPLILPPLVVGLCLLILFRQTLLRSLDDRFPIAFHVPAVILAQFTVAAAFAVRTLRATFDELSPRQEQVALTLGCSRAGLLDGRPSRSALRPADGGHAGLGPLAGRIRADPRFRRRDAAKDRSPAHERVPRIHRRQRRGSRRRLAADDRRRARRPLHRADVRPPRVKSWGKLTSPSSVEPPACLYLFD